MIVKVLNANGYPEQIGLKICRERQKIIQVLAYLLWKIGDTNLNAN